MTVVTARMKDMDGGGRHDMRADQAPYQVVGNTVLLCQNARRGPIRHGDAESKRRGSRFAYLVRRRRTYF